ncbi:hypothetical protein EYS10_21300 [Rahnella aquatilis]|nr:hypothetical protein EYS10_21300 [Rahnella aquatilis]
MSLDNFKKEIEVALRIKNWSPTNSQLEEIAKRLKEFDGEPTRANIESLVCEVLGSINVAGLEGIDNSDLTTLLLLATKTNSDDDK